MVNPPIADIGAEHAVNLPREDRRAWRLARVPTGQAENFFQKCRVSFAAPFARPQVMLDDPLDHRLVQLVREAAPIHIVTLVDERISAESREPGENAVALGGMGEAVRSEIAPEVLTTDGFDPVVGQKGRAQRHAVEWGYLR